MISPCVRIRGSVPIPPRIIRSAPGRAKPGDYALQWNALCGPQSIMWHAIYHVLECFGLPRFRPCTYLGCVSGRQAGGRLRGRRARAVMMRIHCARARSRRVDRRRLVRIPSTLRIQIHVRAASGSHSGRWTVECTTLFRPPANRAAEA